MDYQQLIEDFNSGKLDKEKWRLIMDSDDGYLTYIGDDVENPDSLSDEMNKKYGRPDGYHDIVQILNIIGVPTEWC